MGEVGNFIFGGSSKKEKSQNSSEQESTSTSTNESESSNNSVQASASGSKNSQRSGSAGYNQAYAPIAGAMTPVLGNTLAASTMMASLLGLPAPSYSYAQTPYSPGASVLPPAAEVDTSAGDIPDLAAIVDALAGSTPTLPPPAPTPAPNPTTPPPAAPPPAAPPPAAPPPPPPAGGGYSPGPVIGHNPYVSPKQGYTNNQPAPLQQLAEGGTVRAGEPVIVGENEPEVFVPSTAGRVIAGPIGQESRQARVAARVARRNALMNGAPIGNFQWGQGGRTWTPKAPGTTPTAPGTPGAPAPGTVPGGSSTTPTPAQTGLNGYAQSAGMDFILDQGQKAISGASAANGTFNSGATGKALMQYGTNLGSTYLDKYIGHLMGYGQLGLGAASGMSGAGSVNTSQSAGGGGSSSVSGGLSSGSSSSSGSSNSSSSGSSQGTGTASGNSKNGVLPAAASVIGAVGSDIRLKTDVVKIGEFSDGLGIYEYDYIDGFDLPQGRQRGVMAHEVKVLRPEAYVPNFIGEYAGVNYDKLGDY